MRLSVPVLLFTAAVAMLSGVLFGCAPAWQATRLNLNDALKEGGRGAIGGGRHRIRRVLVAAEFALALTLLAGGGLAVHSLVRLNRTELGFRSERLVTASLPVPSNRLQGRERIQAFYRQMLEKIQVVPGVSSAAVSTGIPVEGTSFGMLFDVVGQPSAEGSDRSGAGFNMVSPAYFDTFGIPIVRGRALTESDADGGMPVCVVNESFARQHLRGLDPLAQRLRIERLDPALAARGPVDWQIVGVSRDVRNGGPQPGGLPRDRRAVLAEPVAQRDAERADVGRSRSRCAAGSRRSSAPSTPIFPSPTSGRWTRSCASGSPATASARSSSGASRAWPCSSPRSGSTASCRSSVAQRRHELGVRFALGATRAHVLGLVLKDGLAVALVGTALGFVGAFWLGRAMQGMFEGIPGLDTARFALMAATLIATAALACYLPARRASRVDPLTALREE